MSEKKTDDCMREALLMAAAQRFAETPDWQGENSPKYQRRFKRMLADPFEYVKRLWCCWRLPAAVFFAFHSCAL